ncbi:deoxyribose-phosphate aldolase [Pararhizobium antarcticum]|uniref:Deoxyribose-phosphate aldolase n=1 Tax=Pararhizobium antarcticum TaxID=1798805 RepID=A0A657LQV2_9HYPH|nr:deoxyribose-phosphate aldolase [Pararhizobium antarcticum]OJF92117.1 2-deoxyribose-5-phosphate aldolase [Rhizobium sp. 58]OJF94244.1 2-deoxyribose-5-phosphate aldolase [Pararhizobium antarcticum]
MTEATNRQIASLALTLLDLTDLSETCTPADIDTLCADARTPYGHTAAICIWPRFVRQARSILGPASPLRIATVVNFPAGNLTLDAVVTETQDAVSDGADEIDLVIPYRALMAGDEQAVREMIAAVRAACPAPVLLKAILETGELKSRDLIRSASHIAIREGVDFIKTSTGKTPVNATLEAADIMLTCIRESGRKIGFKPAGGVGTVAEARLYMNLANTIMGPDWVMPSTFRFGASSLLKDILSMIDGRESAAKSATAY